MFVDLPRRDSVVADVPTYVTEWARKSLRVFPWRSTVDPYKVLIAEALLQRTPAKRVEPVYRLLVDLYPNPTALASGDPEQVKKIIAPLGLLKRGIQLIDMTREIVVRFGGQVPDNLEDLQSLPGVGRYIAGAVLCFAFQKPVALLDNVSRRVYLRLVGTDSGTERRVELEAFVRSVVPQNEARLFNLGVLDIGALFCRPRRPCCGDCPLRQACASGRTCAQPATTVEV